MSVVTLPVATGVRFDGDRVVFVLSNDGDLSFPLNAFPRLRDASSRERLGWELRWDGTAVRWEGIDEDVSIRQLLLGTCAAAGGDNPPTGDA